MLKTDKISKDQIAKWVQACWMYAKETNLKIGSEKHIRMEHAMLMRLAATELRVGIEQVMNDQLPPIVNVCFLSFRPLSSIMLDEDGQINFDHAPR